MDYYHAILYAEPQAGYKFRGDNMKKVVLLTTSQDIEVSLGMIDLLVKKTVELNTENHIFIDRSINSFPRQGLYILPETLEDIKTQLDDAMNAHEGVFIVLIDRKDIEPFIKTINHDCFFDMKNANIVDVQNIYIEILNKLFPAIAKYKPEMFELRPEQFLHSKEYNEEDQCVP